MKKWQVKCQLLKRFEWGSACLDEAGVVFPASLIEAGATTNSPQLAQLGDAAGADVLGDVDVAIGIEAGVVRMDE